MPDSTALFRHRFTAKALLSQLGGDGDTRHYLVPIAVAEAANDVCLVLAELSQFVLRVCCEIDDVVFGLGLVGPQAIIGFFLPFCV
jgi:hypothetical protein